MSLFRTSQLAKTVLAFLAQNLQRGLANAEVQKRIENNGLVPFPAGREELRKFVASETIKWADLVKGAGIEAGKTLPRSIDDGTFARHAHCVAMGGGRGRRKLDLNDVGDICRPPYACKNQCLACRRRSDCRSLDRDVSWREKCNGAKRKESRRTSMRAIRGPI